MAITISSRIEKKLRDKHGVEPREVEQCLFNRTHRSIIDTEEDHQTDPVTQWIIAPTNKGRVLAVYFVINDGDVRVKTAFEPGKERVTKYLAVARPLE